MKSRHSAATPATNRRENTSDKNLTFALLFGDESYFSDDSIDHLSNDSQSNESLFISDEAFTRSLRSDLPLGRNELIRVETERFIVTKL